jgi:serine/threonine-protein kinase HipA
MTSRILEASINRRPVGQLTEISGLWSFQYCGSWLKEDQRFPLSPHLPLQPDPILDGATHRPVQWFFDNLLPEEGQRALLAKDAKVADADAFGLLAHYGAESAGALTLLLPNRPELQPGGLKPLSDADLSARIKALPHAPLSREATKRMSLAGAQHKLAVVLDHNALFEPIGPQPSTHILKPDHPDPDYPQSVINEWFCMMLASSLRLPVPQVYRRYVPEPVYLIQRFDRSRQNNSWLRLHAIDACQLLNLDRSFKYAQGSIENLSALANACRSPAVARTRLFSWLVFNVLIGNSDAHLKNLSFIVTPTGIQLSPHYDLLSAALYDSQAYSKPGWPKATTLAWPILKTDRFADVTRLLLIDAAGAMGIQKQTADRLIEYQHQRIVATAEEIYATLEAAADGVVTPAGELRCVRAILHTVIMQMVAQLKHGK